LGRGVILPWPRSFFLFFFFGIQYCVDVVEVEVRSSCIIVLRIIHAHTHLSMLRTFFLLPDNLSRKSTLDYTEYIILENLKDCQLLFFNDLISWVQQRRKIPDDYSYAT
jgi:hypothetical protein